MWTRRPSTRRSTTPRWPTRTTRKLLPRSILVILACVGLGTALGLFVGPRLADHDGGGAPEAASELPGGGSSVLPEHRVVAFYGAPPVDELGVLGLESPQRTARKLRRLARDYELPDRPVLPAFELIAVIAHPTPAKSGDYSARQPDALIRRYVDAAERNGFLALLDIQPGRADFPSEVEALRPYLDSPNVGIALDPEWRMGPNQIPGQVIGGVKASEVNRVSELIGETVEEQGLPDKLLVIHQFTPEMVRDKGRLRPYPGVDLVLNSDGFGGAADKRAKYHQLAPRGTSAFYRGFKLFYSEDTGLMSPDQVLALKPAPVDLVIYE